VSDEIHEVPKKGELFIPVMKALRGLGGSGSTEEIDNKVVELEKYPAEVIGKLHGEGPSTEIKYRLAWARTNLKTYGVLENSNRGIWAIIDDKKDINPDDVLRFVQAQSKRRNDKIIESQDIEDSEIENKIWEQDLLDMILNLTPDAFERLVQRILRESGLLQVEVTGKTGDGGIDGKGVFKIAELFSFNVVFQCKKYKNTVVPACDIRDFRGALQGRADKGLFVTTGRFTNEARKEASRDGAIPIDLIDGEGLVKKIKDIKLGVSIEYVEKITIHKEWYEKI